MMGDWLDDPERETIEDYDLDIQEKLEQIDIELAANAPEKPTAGERAMPWREGSSSARGSRFEAWCNENLMDNRAERLRIETADNARLGLAAQQRRISDDYWVRDNAIWDFKCGYEKAHISRWQLNDYWRMMDERGVKAIRDGRTLKGEINTVNYLFDSRAGALNNQELIESTGSERIFIWYLDDHNEPTPL